MSRFAKLFAANAIGAAGLCSAALALSPAAAADPVLPPAIPGVPALNMIQQFATNPASMGAVLQTAATALNGTAQMVGAPAPNTLPVSPIAVPGAPIPAAPVAPAVPAATPVGPVSALGPLLNQAGFPANLIGLGPTVLPNAIDQTLGVPQVAPAAPVTAPVLPIAPAAPVAPVAPVAGGVINPLPLLNALP